MTQSEKETCLQIIEETLSADEIRMMLAGYLESRIEELNGGHLEKNEGLTEPTAQILSSEGA